VQELQEQSISTVQNVSRLHLANLVHSCN